MSYRSRMSGRMAMAAAACAMLAAPHGAAAQLFLVDPDFKPGPITGADPLVGIAVPGATLAEQRSHMVWNLRAGLNVAALQCQFSPYLRAVDNYNGILAHHSKELAETYTSLTAYFKRVHGAREGQTRFDDYTTSTYNNFSTLHAQYGFCQVASSIAKEALGRPKGELHMLAGARMREFRNSLIPAYDRVGIYNPYDIRPVAFPPLRADCWNRRNELVRKCEGLTG